MTKTFAQLQNDMKRPLIDRISGLSAHTRPHDVDSDYSCAFIRTVSLNVPGQCSCADTYNYCRYIAASALSSTHCSIDDTISLLYQCAHLAWQGYAGETFRTQCSQLSAELSQENCTIYEDMVRCT